jgi:hypothetical protein
MRLLSIAVIAAAASMIAAAQASAEPTVRWELKTLPVHTTYDMPPGSLEAPECSAEGNPALCWLTISGSEEVMKGTFAATGHWTARVWQRENVDGNLAFDGVNYMTGRIKGCGSGTFEYHDYDGTLFTSKFNLSTKSFPAQNKWTIPPGSTRGQLAERLVSGGGDQVWDSYPFNQDPDERNWGSGTITGTVVCRVPVREGRNGPRAGSRARRAKVR